MTKGQLSPDNSLDDVKIRIQKSYTNPNVGTITQVVLKEGPRAFKVATLLEIINPNNGKFHHYSLKIDHINRSKKGWFHKPEQSVRLESKEPNEIEKLYKFLHVTFEETLSASAGDLHIIHTSDYMKLENVISAIPNIAETDKLHLVGTILSQLNEKSSSLSDFVNILNKSKSETINNIATASRLIEYTNSVNELKHIIETRNTPEVTSKNTLKRILGCLVANIVNYYLEKLGHVMTG